MSDAYTERLLDLAYGELSTREARQVEAHAASCEACRAELARIRGTRRVMAALPDEAAPERGERILIAAAREAAEARRPRRLVPRWLLGGAVVAASVAVVAAVSLRVSEWTPRHGEEPSQLQSPYAARPLDFEAPPAASPPPVRAPDPRDASSAERVAGAAPEAKDARAKPGRVAAAPPASRREAAPAPA